MRVIPRLDHQGAPEVDLNEYYTYVALDLGPIYIPADSGDGWVKTHWHHHVSLTYLPDINPQLLSQIKEDLESTTFKYFKMSGTDPRDPERHFSSRPNHLPHYRDVQLPTGNEGIYDSPPTKPIVAFTWEAIKERAMQDPPTIKMPKAQFTGSGHQMNNLINIHRAFTDFVEKRHDYQVRERLAIHSQMYDNQECGVDAAQTHYLAIVTDQWGGIVLPGEIATLCDYLIDRLATKGVKALFPPTDVFLTPRHRLHMTPQTRTGLHGDNADAEKYQVPVDSCDHRELLALKDYRGIQCYLNTDPNATEIRIDHLRAPTYGNAEWNDRNTYPTRRTPIPLWCDKFEIVEVMGETKRRASSERIEGTGGRMTETVPAEIVKRPKLKLVTTEIPDEIRIGSIITLNRHQRPQYDDKMRAWLDKAVDDLYKTDQAVQQDDHDHNLSRLGLSLIHI